MRRLIKKSDAARLLDIYIDPQIAMDAIQSVDGYFNKEKMIKDSAAFRFSYWGSISDDGNYVAEAYMYTAPQRERKCAYVVFKIDSEGNPSSNPEVIVKRVYGGSELRSLLKLEGLTLQDGTKLTFNNEFKSLNEVLEYNENDDNLKLAKKEKEKYNE